MTLDRIADRYPPIPLTRLDDMYASVQLVPGNRCAHHYKDGKVSLWVTRPPKNHVRCDIHRYDDLMNFENFDPMAGPGDFSLWQKDYQFCLAANTLLMRQEMEQRADSKLVNEVISEAMEKTADAINDGAIDLGDGVEVSAEFRKHSE